MDGMSPKLFVTNKVRNKMKTDGKVVSDLNVISHEMEKKEVDAPLYLRARQTGI